MSDNQSPKKETQKRRHFFSELLHAEGKIFSLEMKELYQKDLNNFRKKWNFDPVLDTPLPGKYVWDPISSAQERDKNPPAGKTLSEHAEANTSTNTFDKVTDSKGLIKYVIDEKTKRLQKKLEKKLEKKLLAGAQDDNLFRLSDFYEEIKIFWKKWNIQPETETVEQRQTSTEVLNYSGTPEDSKSSISGNISSDFSQFYKERPTSSLQTSTISPPDDQVFANETCTQETNERLVRRTSSSVGSGGARLEVGGCVVEIPPGALDRQVHIKLTSYYGKNEGGDTMSLTPTLECQPSGLKFSKPVRMTLSTCYITEDRSPALVEVRTSEDGNAWREVMSVVYNNNLRIEFTTRHFSRWEAIASIFPVLRWNKMKSIVFKKLHVVKVGVIARYSCILGDCNEVEQKVAYPDRVGIPFKFPLKSSNADLSVTIKTSMIDGQLDLGYTVTPQLFAIKDAYDTPIVENIFDVKKVCKLETPPYFNTLIKYSVSNLGKKLEGSVSINIDPQKDSMKKIQNIFQPINSIPSSQGETAKSQINTNAQNIMIEDSKVSESTLGKQSVAADSQEACYSVKSSPELSGVSDRSPPAKKRNRGGNGAVRTLQGH